MKINLPITQNEVLLSDDQMVVTTTDLKGVITSVNREFIELSGFSEQELVGSSHHIVRHPDMPAVVFRQVWQNLKDGYPWTGLIKNRCKNGDYYWVEANISPLYEKDVLKGYISVRYKASRKAIIEAEKIYSQLTCHPDSASLLHHHTYLSDSYRLVNTRLFRSSLLIGSLSLTALFAWLHNPVGLLAFGGLSLLLNHRLSVNPVSRYIEHAVAALRTMAQSDFKYPLYPDRKNDCIRLHAAIKSAQIRLAYSIDENARITRKLEQEITARNLSDKLLKKQRWFTEQLEEALNNFALVSVTDQQGNITFANRKFCEVSGYTREELMGQNHRIISSGRHDQAFFKTMWETIRAGEVWQGEVCNKRKDGSFYWVDATIKSASREEGAIEFFISVRRDITEEVENRRLLATGKLEAESLLREKQVQLTTILENIGSAVYMKSLDSRYLYANQAYARFYRMEASALLGLTDDELKSRAGLDQAVLDDQVLRVAEHAESMEVMAIPDDTGEERYYWCLKIPLSRDDGSVYAILGILTDITERKRLENERVFYAEQAIRVKTEFLANISHEIRTPMNSVMAATELLRDGDFNGEQWHYLDILSFSCQHVLRLINDMLELSKIEAGQWKMEFIPFNLPELMTVTLRGLMPLAQSKGLSMILDMSEQIPGTLMGSPQRLAQIITNLSNNAIKFTRHGTVTVSVQPVIKPSEANNAGAVVSIRFAVEDTGIGIPAEHLGKIFTAFEQVHQQNVEGTGLGLTISSSLVYLMGGQLRVESCVGEGSIFYFDLDFLKADADSDLSSTEQMSLHTLTDKRILLVEDNRINRELACKRLLKLGCQVVTAEDGQMALDAASQEAFDLILMDMRMPVMDGPTATRLLREREAATGQPRIPIVALTANAHDEDIAICMDSGMDGHVSKPFSIDMLLKGIASAQARVLQGTVTAATEAVIPDQLMQADALDFDPAAALLMVDEDAGLLASVIIQFMEYYPAMWADIREAAMAGEPEKGRSVAHSLKANTGYLVALPLTEQARHMEKLFSSGLMEEAREALPLFEETGNRLLRALQAYMDEQDGV